MMTYVVLSRSLLLTYILYAASYNKYLPSLFLLCRLILLSLLLCFRPRACVSVTYEH